MVTAAPAYKHARGRGSTENEGGGSEQIAASSGSSVWRNNLPFLRRLRSPLPSSSTNPSRKSTNDCTQQPLSLSVYVGSSSKSIATSSGNANRVQPLSTTPSSVSGDTTSRDQPVESSSYISFQQEIKQDRAESSELVEHIQQATIESKTTKYCQREDNETSDDDDFVLSNDAERSTADNNKEDLQETNYETVFMESSYYAGEPSEDSRSLHRRRSKSISSHEGRARSRSQPHKSTTKKKKKKATLLTEIVQQNEPDAQPTLIGQGTNTDTAPSSSDHDRFRRLLGEAFRKCLACDTYKKELKSIVDMIKNDPNLCKYQYTVVHRLPAVSSHKQEEKHVPVQLFPLHILCAIGATPFIIRKVWRAHPPAVTMASDPNSIIGSPLHYACLFHTHHHQEVSCKEATSYLEVVQFLVTKNPALLVCSTNKDRRTPLHYSCLCSFPPPVKPKETKITSQLPRCLENKLRLNCPETDSTSTCSTGSGSCSSGDRQPLTCTQLSLSPSPKETERIKCKDAVSLMMNANGNEVLAFLTKMFPRAVSKVDAHGYTPLHLACLSKSPSLDVIEHMLRLSPESCVKQATDGCTPIHIVASHYVSDDDKLNLVLKIMKTLLRANDGMKALSMRDCRGYLPLHACVECSRPHVYELKLLKFLVKKYPEGLNVQDNSNRTPRVLASVNKLDTECVRLLSPFV